MTDQPAAPRAKGAPPRAGSAPSLHPGLARYAEVRLPEARQLADERKARLDVLARFIEGRLAAGERARLIFICTHNSRRSHISQLWAATAAAYYGVANVDTYSGGTEVTAFNPRAVAAMQRAGFDVSDGDGDNPHYTVTFSPAGPPQECFSKKYDDPFNPQQGFAAVMTCSQADESCPVVFGAAERVALPYVDPKQADGTPEEAAAYDARTRQIAVEMLYLFGALVS